MKKNFILIVFVCYLGSNFGFSQSIVIDPADQSEVIIRQKDNGIPTVSGKHSRLGMTPAQAVSTPSNTLLRIGAQGFMGTAFSDNVAQINMSPTESFSSTAAGTKITFHTTLNGTTNTSEKMRIDNNGNVGIGTTAPDAKLYVVGSQDNNGTLGTFKVSNGPNDMIFDSNEIDVSGDNQLYLNNNSAGNVSIGTGGGKVGIGTNTPTAKLDVEGDFVIKKSMITVTGTYNNLNRSNSSSLYFNANGAVTLNGIAGGVDGMILYIINGAGTTLTITNVSSNASPENRIATHTGNNVVIADRGGATLVYEATSGYWRIIGIAQ